jgi:DNA-binding NarL/FixJ family response regulator
VQPYCPTVSSEEDSLRPRFTDRELVVIRAFLDGSREPEIAAELHLTEEQVYTYVRHVAEKLDMYVRVHRLRPPEAGSEW